MIPPAHVTVMARMLMRPASICAAYYTTIVLQLPLECVSVCQGMPFVQQDKLGIMARSEASRGSMSRRSHPQQIPQRRRLESLPSVLFGGVLD